MKFIVQSETTENLSTTTTTNKITHTQTQQKELY